MKTYVKQEFMVSGQMIFRQNTPTLVSDSTNMIQFAFSFNEAWEDISKTAIIVTAGIAYTCPILDDGTIAEEIMPVLQPGKCFVSVFGSSLNTANTCTLIINSSGYSALVPPEPPEPGQIYVKSVANQIYFIRENLGNFEYSLDGQIWKVVSGGGGGISGKSPYIGENGNWYQFDDTTGAWIDTGVKAEGLQGPSGSKGDSGEPGLPGVGVPTGGNVGQVLVKQSNDDFDTKWVDQSGDGVPTLTLNVGTGGDFEKLSDAIAYAKTLDILSLRITFVSDVTEISQVRISGYSFKQKNISILINWNSYTLYFNNTSLTSYALGFDDLSDIFLINLRIVTNTTKTSMFILDINTGISCKIFGWYIENTGGVKVDRALSLYGCSDFCETYHLPGDPSFNKSAKNCTIALFADRNSTITLWTPPTFTNVTTQYSPVKNTLGNSNSYISAP